MRMLTNSFVLTVCDDIIEQELLETSKAGQDPTTNDFMITEVPTEHLDESLKDERRGVLYRYHFSDQLPEDVLYSTLGKKRKIAPNSDLEKAMALDYVRDYVIVEKDNQNMSQDQSMPHQAADFLLVSKAKNFTSSSGSGEPVQYIPLSNKLSLHKNKKKRLDKPRRTAFDGDDDISAPKVSKISEKVPDQYVLAARGFSSKEVSEANSFLNSLHCEVEISKDDTGNFPGISFFRTPEDLNDCQKAERKYLKSILKKFKKSAKGGKNDAGSENGINNEEPIPEEDLF